jgi:hypothetical protein
LDEADEPLAEKILCKEFLSLLEISSVVLQTGFSF